MPLTINEVVAQVEPEPTAPSEQPQAPTRDNGAELVRAQLALLARRAARLQAN
jgi:hypothetical protein